MKTPTPLFIIESIFVTPGITRYLDGEEETSAQEQRARSGWITSCVARTLFGDWGVVDAHDQSANDEALTVGARTLSAYERDGMRAWVFTYSTETPGQRRIEVMRPDEY